MTGAPLAVAVALSLLAPPEEGPPRWVDPQDSFSQLSAFLVRVDVHAKPQDAAAISAADVKQQLERSLRARGISVATALGESPHGLGFLNLDVHVVTAGGETSVSWTLHASQIVRLHGGGATLGGTWEVGDLVHAPRRRVAARLRDSLQPAIDDFCAAYLRGRAATGAPEPTPAPPEADRPPEEPGVDL